MASLVQRNGVWYVAWREGTRQRRKSLETRSLVEARRRFNLWQRDQAERKWLPAPPKNDPKVDEFWPKYERWLRTEKAKATADNRKAHWAAFKRHFEPVRLGDVKTVHVERFKQDWTEAGKNPVSLNTFLRELRVLYNDARRVHLGDDGPLYNGANPFAGVKHAPVPKKDDPVCSAAELDKLLEAAADVAKSEPGAGDVHLVVALACYAGLRRKEIDWLRWEMIDWAAKTIHLAQGDGFTTKSGRDRVIPLADKLAAILEPHKRDVGYVYHPDRAPVEGRRYRADVRHWFDMAAAKAGLPWVTPHSLRHTWFTRLLKAGVSIALVSQWGGHSSIEVTVDIYGHLEGFHEGINKL